PIIQVIIYYKIPQYNIYLAFFIAFMLTIVISALSWRFIEKPIIEKRYFTSSR
ncbi:acyltransferase, partial [Bacteroides salyersiae]